MNNKDLTPILHEDYIGEETSISLSQEQLALLLPILETEMSRLDTKIEKAGFGKDVWENEKNTINRIYTILDDEYYAKEFVGDPDDTWFDEGEEVL
ncbi:MAG: hypothetical protein EOL97_14065 [Spirochaetia bacterium]|nr:hypothetical protein [Spirochaetia bacterium]